MFGIKISFILYTLYSILFLWPPAANAHAFGALYNLPVPFWLYLYGGGATLIISFLLIGYFLGNSSKFHLRQKRLPSLDFFMNPVLVKFLKVSSVFLLLLTILTGFFGVNNTLLNFNMTYFWIIFFLGYYYLTALFGNTYEVLNPFKTLLGKINSQFLNYPKKIGILPALIFFYILILLELFGAVTPFQLSALALLYLIVNYIGVLLVGKSAWFENCEVFSVLFRIIGKCSPFKLKERNIYLTIPFTGLIEKPAESLSVVIFILFMLSSTAFDGLHSTLPWYYFLLNFSLDLETLQKFFLILSPFFFFVLFLIATAIMQFLTNSKISVFELMKKFAYTLVPIALVYNLAHYYTLFINQGAQIIRLVSDPFGFGWNLFGTANFEGVLFSNVGFIWHSQVVLILIGHVVAVYLAHLVALEVFKTKKLAVLSQIPILILMVIFTVIGLWILSQPITTRI